MEEEREGEEKLQPTLNHQQILTRYREGSPGAGSMYEVIDTLHTRNLSSYFTIFRNSVNKTIDHLDYPNPPFFFISDTYYVRKTM